VLQKHRRCSDDDDRGLRNMDVGPKHGLLLHWGFGINLLQRGRAPKGSNKQGGAGWFVSSVDSLWPFGSY
jgi:hypothetical protein